MLQIFLCLVNKFCFIINFLFVVFDNSCSLINVDMLSFSFDREVMFFSFKIDISRCIVLNLYDGYLHFYSALKSSKTC